MITRADVREALNTIIDPCSIRAGMPASIGEMGLIHAISITETADGAHVAIVLGVTDPTCLMAAVFVAEAHQRIGALEGVAHVEVTLDHTVLWTPDRLDPAYSRRLKSHRASEAGKDAVMAR
ncbi:metal-sulfur cluster assembly factor [Sphingobium algorifonticola]|uniref:DUF59 domain-containing protein n=1 Tax=Sphingobium algorifonticola TaxID=2008318 RepID=A0A437JAE2_9SPHN|nr:iron-sulfur cluster assembly protein [Sphingobium algorifonticola]RVT42353.1 DUF59 domain-containing protein [Sphingobium algorifonticola]